MPRTSAAALTVVPAVRGSSDLARPEPPAHLTDAACVIWREVAASRPADYWDRASCGLLEAYSIALAEHRRLMAAVATLDPLADLTAYAKLTRLADAHAGRLSQLATRMRLSQQSRTDSRGAGRAANKNPGPAGLEEMRDRYGAA